MTGVNEADIDAERKRRNYEYQLRWRRENPDKIRAYGKRAYEKDIEKSRSVGREGNRRRRVERPEYDAEIARRYRQRHPEKTAEIAKRFYWAHRDDLAEENRKWRAAHPEYGKERRRLLLIENPNLDAEQYAKNKVRLQASAKQWRKDNPDGAREISRRNFNRRRAKKAMSSEHYTIAEIKELRRKSGGKCAYCKSKGRMTIDHIVALASGGSNGIRNIQFLCKSCNASKQDSDPIEFARKRGLLL